MKRLVDTDQFPDFPGSRKPVQISYSLTRHQAAPLLPFVAYMEEIWHSLIGSHKIRGLLIRKNKEEPTFNRKQIPYRQISRAGSQFAIIVVREALIEIFIKIVDTSHRQQTGLIVLSHFLKPVNRFLKRHSPAN